MSEPHDRGVFFSVIVPAYNRATLIAATIESVLEQTFFQFELIIVNDGSTDNTVEVVEPYLLDNRVKLFTITNSERGAARNFGVRQSQGKYVTFLDSDDLFLPWHLQTAYTKISNDPHPIFHLGYEVLHPDGRIDTLPHLPKTVNEKLLEGNFLSCMGVFLQREVALANPFDEDRKLSGSEDYELWLRIASRMPIVCFPEVTSRLINHDARSVITTASRSLVDRMISLDVKLKSDKVFVQTFGNRLDKFASYRTLYLALHLVMSGERWLATRSLLFTVRKFPRVVFNYRFIVVVKKILVG